MMINTMTRSPNGHLTRLVQKVLLHQRHHHKSRWRLFPVLYILYHLYLYILYHLYQHNSLNQQVIPRNHFTRVIILSQFQYLLHLLDKLHFLSLNHLPDKLHSQFHNKIMHTRSKVTYHYPHIFQTEGLLETFHQLHLQEVVYQLVQEELLHRLQLQDVDQLRHLHLIAPLQLNL